MPAGGLEQRRHLRRRQRFTDPARERALRTRHRRHPRIDRPAPRPAGSGGDRERAHAGPGERAEDDAGVDRARRAFRPRRLRHRLLVPLLSAALPLPQDQDRPVFCQHALRLEGLGADRDDHPGAGELAGHDDHGRRRRNRGSVGDAGRARLRRGPGLPARAPGGATGRNGRR